MKQAVVIVAAGSGTRSGEGVPKQFRPLAGLAMLRRTVAAFLAVAEIDAVVCVIGEGQRPLYDASVVPGPRLREPVTGGATRQASVLAGLRALAADPPERVLVHDAARPFVTAETIRDVLAAINGGRGAVPALPIVDTLARAEDGAHGGVVDRSGLVAVQTPQGFPFDPLLRLHEAATAEHTDDAGLARAGGLAVAVVPGERGNVKITTPEDLAIAEARLAPPDIRVGHGYDTHRWTTGTSVRLCGVDIPHDAALDGHSDADVGLHALTDALLATVAAGDIGDHFPPSDPQWRGVSSDRFLAHARDLVAVAGGRITHADVTLVCERPKIGPHRDAMRERVAGILDVAVDRISVKATTNEERGFVGRGEGMVALATATVAFP